MVISKPIIDEYTRVAEEIAAKFPQLNIAPILDLFILNSEIVDTGDLRITACEDPDGCVKLIVSAPSCGPSFSFSLPDKWSNKTPNSLIVGS